MLLPSALPCEPRPQLRRYPSYAPNPFSPPPTPDSPSQLSSGISTTCRALQSLLGVHPPASSLNRQRKSNSANTNNATARTATRVAKRPPPPPRGLNKRRRDKYEEDLHCGDDNSDQENEGVRLFSTPKRQRRAPPSIPFGLERSDFYALQPPSLPRTAASPQLRNLSLSSSPPMSIAAITEPSALAEVVPSNESPSDETSWDTEDDRMLVDLVLDKLKLSKKEWNECARVLGADEKSLGKRWKALVDDGQVGLRIRRGGKSRRPDVRDVRWT